MPIFSKFDGVDGESTDHFEFKKATGATDIVWNDGDTAPEPMATMLLPAVQSAREAARRGDDDGGQTPPDIIIWDIDGDGEGYYQPALAGMDWLG
jgi:hypothetical protein